VDHRSLESGGFPVPGEFRTVHPVRIGHRCKQHAGKTGNLDKAQGFLSGFRGIGKKFLMGVSRVDIDFV
jgi:hypothetical protein